MPAASAKSIAVAKEKLFKVLAELHYFGKTTFDIKDVARSAGYSCITGKAIRAAIKELKDENVFTREKDDITLTEEGIESLPQVDTSSLPTDEEKQQKILEAIMKDDSDCKPITNAEKTKDVFDTLLDGKSHTKQELVEVAGYKRMDTKQIRNLFKKMLKLGILENDETSKGSVRFADSVWPVKGRPTTINCSGDVDVGDEKKQQISGRKRKTMA